MLDDLIYFEMQSKKSNSHTNFQSPDSQKSNIVNIDYKTYLITFIIVT